MLHAAPSWTLVHHVLLNTACPSFRCQALKHPGELPLWDQALWLWSEWAAHRLHGQLLCGHSLVHVCEFELSCSPLLILIRPVARRLQIYVLDGFQFTGDLVLLRHKSAGIDLFVRFRSKGQFIFQASAVFQKNKKKALMKMEAVQIVVLLGWYNELLNYGLILKT